MTWRAPRDVRPGRLAVFSDAAIQFCLSAELLFRVPLRQTAGMAASPRLGWPVPDLFTLCRRQKTSAVQIPCRHADGPLNLLADSTGIKFLGNGNGNGNGEWQTRRRADAGRGAAASGARRIWR